MATPSRTIPSIVGTEIAPRRMGSNSLLPNPTPSKSKLWLYWWHAFGKTHIVHESAAWLPARYFVAQAGTSTATPLSEPRFRSCARNAARVHSMQSLACFRVGAGADKQTIHGAPPARTAKGGGTSLRQSSQLQNQSAYCIHGS